MKLRVLDAAEREVTNAFDYYESQSESASRMVVACGRSKTQTKELEKLKNLLK